MKTSEDLGPAPSQVIAPRLSDGEDYTPLFGVHHDMVAPAVNPEDAIIGDEVRNQLKKSGSTTHAMLWPTIGTRALSEYDTTLKIFCMAFPDLFPGGVGDFNDH